MDSRYFNDGIEMSPHVAAADEVVLVIDQELPWAAHFSNEAEARKAYSGTVFQMWSTQLLGVQFLILSPIQVDEEAPSTKKKILIGVIAWAVGQLPKVESGLSQQQHRQIHQIEKLWGQK